MITSWDLSDVGFVFILDQISIIRQVGVASPTVSYWLYVNTQPM